MGEHTRWVVSHVVPRLRVARITLTAPILNRARELRILVAGEDKAATLRAVFQERRDPERMPVQLIQPDGGRLVWLIDRAAAGALDPVESAT